MSFESTCHCGALKATVEGDIPNEGMTCNCSICRRKGHILHFVPAEQATIEAADTALGDYTFNKHAIHHHFCKTCGCSPFATGQAPDGNAMVVVNLRCVTDCDVEALSITKVDGASF